jgi:hypothetical protein
MSLKKTIATKEGGYDIDMHPLEENSIRCYWNIHDTKIKCPPKPTREEEHEWLIIYGAPYVQKKREEWQAAHDAAQPDIEAANKKFQEAHQAWCDHCALCCAHGFNPDEFPGDAREKLTMPEVDANAAS